MRVLLMDECEDMDIIDVPTLHVVGCNDPYILGAMALFNMCDGDSAELFDHGKGHTVPRDGKTVEELSGAVGRLVKKKEVWNHNTIDMFELRPDEVGTMKQVVGTNQGARVAVLNLPV